MLFKDEVRRVGEELGMPHDMVWRQPFPGPGLAIRIMGDITPDKLETVRESDAILREEVALAGLDRDINQYFTVLTNTRTVGVMGDERTHDFVLGHPRRDDRRLHDRRLGASALRPAGQGQRAHCQ